MLRSFSLAVIRRHTLHVLLLWQCAPLPPLLCLVLAVVAAGAGTAAMVTTGRLVASFPAALAGGFGSPAADVAWNWLITTAALFVAAPVSVAALAAVGQAVSARYLLAVLDMTIEVGTHPHGVAHLEEPRSAGELTAVTRASEDWLFIAGVHAGWTLLSIRLGGVGAFIVLAGWSWWVAATLLAGWLLLSRAFGQWSNTIFDNLLEVTGNDRRRAGYLRSLLTELPSAKEVRLFDLTGWLIDRYVATWHNAMRPVWAHRTRGLRTTLLVMLVPLAVNVMVVLLLAREAWTGVIGAGTVVTLAQAVLAMSAFGPQQDPQLFLAHTMAVVSELARLRSKHWLTPLPRTGPSRQSPPHRAFPSQEPSPGQNPEHNVAPNRQENRAASIALHDVSFTYPSEDRPTLSKLSLEIPAGQSVALIGVNGVGKSTLIKLLCGLYRPDQGTVRLDDADPGVDERTRQRIAVIFQDFVRYHLPLRDNVAMGAGSAAVSDQRLVEEALRDAGGPSVLASLEHGWDTVLSAEYDGGTDLSGGQWQRVAGIRRTSLGSRRSGAR
ncbi:ATP-binding cassette domain-containing protein [Actinopolymorpha alba]|uniref:ATP-binding cassette domain-containing protein n=1 Tax=Actinopolymorpha alba TaxID=533267 RepID=UPI00039E6867|nr:ABC transporter ATP-binding protein [Actinopolymorpha alba]